MGRKSITNTPLTVALDLNEAGKLLRRWQLNEWALDKKMTKKALKEQHVVVRELLSRLCWREVNDSEVEQVVVSLN